MNAKEEIEKQAPDACERRATVTLFFKRGAPFSIHLVPTREEYIHYLFVCLFTLQ